MCMRYMGILIFDFGKVADTVLICRHKRSLSAAQKKGGGGGSATFTWDLYYRKDNTTKAQPNEDPSIMKIPSKSSPLAQI